MQVYCEGSALHMASTARLASCSAPMELRCPSRSPCRLCGLLYRLLAMSCNQVRAHFVCLMDEYDARNSTACIAACSTPMELRCPSGSPCRLCGLLCRLPVMSCIPAVGWFVWQGWLLNKSGCRTAQRA